MGKNNVSGAWGEALAADYMRLKGYNVTNIGYSCRFGEIDVIATNEKFIVFVEVKLRKNDQFAEAHEHVDRFKQNRLRSTAQMFLSRFPSELQPRFDVLEIYAPEGYSSKQVKIRHMEDAFQ